MLPTVLLLLFLQLAAAPSSALDFIFNSFPAGANLTLINHARIDPPVIRFTNDSEQYSSGRAFLPYRVPFKPPNSTNATTSFSTQFVFSILPEIADSPGFGLAFVLSNTTTPPRVVAGQYFGLFTSPPRTVAPLLAVEFDTGRNTEFNEVNSNHIGVDLNSVLSEVTETAGYYDSNSTFVEVNMRSGQNVHAWVEFNGPENEINVTIAPAGMPRPARTLLSYKSPLIADYIAAEMFVGFSASKTEWVEVQRLLAWSFSDEGIARDINTTGLPIFRPANPGSSSLSNGAVVGIAVGCVAAVVAAALLLTYWFWWRKRGDLDDDDDDIEDWEMEYWPHKYSYEELSVATKAFSSEELLGSGGFGKVYKATLGNNMEMAVKCVNHDSKQGLREFMAEISSIGRLQHKNLVQLKGWCRKGNELMLVYDYMPNGSLNNWIFDKPKRLLSWEGRKRVLADVAEGLSYLHHGWDQVVVHRDIKSSNVLLDDDLRGRLGDFGLAKLYTHGQVPNTTRVVGTLGYLAPEVVTLASPTAASDVYSFGVVVLEVACGRKPIMTGVADEDEEILIDWVRGKYVQGRILEVADARIEGEYEVGEMEAVLKLGLSCCHPDPSRRPTMKEVTAMLLGEHVEMEPRDMLSGLTPVQSIIDRDEGEKEQEKVFLPPQEEV
ncbi:L-type lectin-domain containing receptor kinase S.1 [Salvia miltiorrhiza]|uniref:L-type lectin-domain containing receptor kinase S.1 n=1 Tax=Salvia miltiorrhiza TaxID=226208 RepID=UPI0025AC6C42|nr:L-type lectin-domain containing receptor kinase S.1 [Salvia miltiorrhiza]